MERIKKEYRDLKINSREVMTMEQAIENHRQMWRIISDRDCSKEEALYSLGFSSKTAPESGCFLCQIAKDIRDASLEVRDEDCAFCPVEHANTYRSSCLNGLFNTWVDKTSSQNPGVVSQEDILTAQATAREIADLPLASWFVEDDLIGKKFIANSSLRMVNASGEIEAVVGLDGITGTIVRNKKTSIGQSNVEVTFSGEFRYIMLTEDVKPLIIN